MQLWRYLYCAIPSLLLLPFAPSAHAQDWVRTGSNLGVEKIRMAAADFKPTSTDPDTPALKATFDATLYADLANAGIFDMVSKTMAPQAMPGSPQEISLPQWSAAPANAEMVAFGALSSTNGRLVVYGWLDDTRNTASPQVLGKQYNEAASQDMARAVAHRFADEIISRLGGGINGIAETKIYFVSSRTGTKEIWVMDYDGNNQHPLTSLKTISLTPRWSPDASRIAFTCFAPSHGIVSPQICMYSVDANKVITFPRFRGTNSSPAWSPDGSKLMFSSSMLGNPEIFMTDANGGAPKRLTFANGASTSPAWNPKTGNSIVYVSDRGGIPKLYMMGVDGTNSIELDLPDKGYLIDPAWAPNGAILAFSWRRPEGNYDIYVMDPSTRQIVEITRDSGRNERPSWAPDGRHIVFESTRSGTRQIWTMLADGSQARQITTQGHNESPNWSPR